jgi:hypothetical protein
MEQPFCPLAFGEDASCSRIRVKPGSNSGFHSTRSNCVHAHAVASVIEGHSSREAENRIGGGIRNPPTIAYKLCD